MTGAARRWVAVLLLAAVIAWAGLESAATAQTTTGSSGLLVDRSLPTETMAVALTGIEGPGLEMRTGGPSGTSDWIPVETPTDESPDPATSGEPEGRASFGPVWLGGGQSWLEVRYRRPSSGLPTLMSAPVIHTITADDIAMVSSASLGERSPGSGGGFSARSVGAVRFLPGRQLLTAPAIRPRSAWASQSWASNVEGCESGPRSASSMKAVVVHHTVTGNNYAADEVDDILRAVHYTHTAINGWCDIGYNFVVDRFGNAWEGRTGSLGGQIIGGHTRGFNTTTVGIALLGQHHRGVTYAGSGVEPSAGALATVQKVAAWKLALHGVDPTGRTWLRNRSDSEPLRLAGTEWHYVPTILGHRDLGVTSCPGDLAYGHVHDLDQEIDKTRSPGEPFNRTAWEHAEHGPALLTATAQGGLLSAGAASGSLTSVESAPSAAPVVAVAGNGEGGYRLRSDGSIGSFGDVPSFTGSGPDESVDVAVAEGGGLWVLAGDGVIHNLGGAPPVTQAALTGVAVAFSLDGYGQGYVVTRDGRLSAVGGAAEIPSDLHPSGPVIDVAVSERRYPGSADEQLTNTSSTTSVWILDDGGTVHSVGPGGKGPSYHFLDSLSGSRRQGLDIGSVDLSLLQGRGLVASVDDGGAWVVDQFGQLWPVGDARLVTPVATRSDAGDVVDVALLDLTAGPGFLDSSDARYVQALHNLFNGVDTSAAKLSAAVYSLEIGYGRDTLVRPLVLGPGWAGTRVDDVFQRVLGRDPAAPGRSYWLNRLVAGMTFEQLGTLFYGSPEYYRSAGGNEAYVRRLYQVLLDREPATDGLRYWSGLLDRGELQPTGVARQFYRSLESRRDRTTRLYDEILSRAPTAGELADGARYLSTADDSDLAVDLAADAEFYRIVAEG